MLTGPNSLRRLGLRQEVANFVVFMANDYPSYAADKIFQPIPGFEAGGNSGHHIAQALLAAKNFTGHRIDARQQRHQSAGRSHCETRGLDVFSTLVDALREQDVLVITLHSLAPPGTREKLIRAAGEAGVKWILPNAWGIDGTYELIARDLPMFAVAKTWALITEIGKSSYIAITTGFWYEWSLDIPDAFGFDFANKRGTLFDGGNSKIPISTWPHNVIFESVLRVTDTDRSEWTVTMEPTAERFSTNKALLGKGDRRAFGRMLYSRVMYADGWGDFLRYSTSINDDLRLLTEDMDDATRRAIKRQQEGDGWSPWRDLLLARRALYEPRTALCNGASRMPAALDAQTADAVEAAREADAKELQVHEGAERTRESVVVVIGEFPVSVDAAFIGKQLSEIDEYFRVTVAVGPSARTRQRHSALTLLVKTQMKDQELTARVARLGKEATRNLVGGLYIVADGSWFNSVGWWNEEGAGWGKEGGME
ncbi:hypothetical protein M427DRAFT_31746 [Gonapodya prolifera JEL478]|uniref:NmrA-like domain-containing protein n=1 Tax=Gonapodya prolifera (strain JEL478) TaxID=1344416 RepID=A0A139AHJ8_GONPJ|nr:hypothetical protein M427DRAFT_31746 [Gonapodya prolifera JEL478]|eukprot:KXS16208.1 hypothetical protein M427DRAFT_31746 [Gonapodya prolifera JEL478]